MFDFQEAEMCILTPFVRIGGMPLLTPLLRLYSVLNLLIIEFIYNPAWYTGIYCQGHHSQMDRGKLLKETSCLGRFFVYRRSLTSTGEVKDPIQ